jgi:hypothetical protein
MVRQRIPREMRAEVWWTRIFWETQNPDRHDKGRVDRRPLGVATQATVRSDREALGEIPAPALFSAPRFPQPAQPSLAFPDHASRPVPLAPGWHRRRRPPPLRHGPAGRATSPPPCGGEEKQHLLTSPLWGGRRAKRSGWGDGLGSTLFLLHGCLPHPALRADPPHKGEGYLPACFTVATPRFRSGSLKDVGGGAWQRRLSFNFY